MSTMMDRPNKNVSLDRGVSKEKIGGFYQLKDRIKEDLMKKKI